MNDKDIRFIMCVCYSIKCLSWKIMLYLEPDVTKIENMHGARTKSFEGLKLVCNI